MDVPLYTVTDWDGAAIPLDAALPVFGGYPDAPWDGSPLALPPPEIYTFRFDNRSAGNMGAIGGNGQGPSSAYQGTPFLTAEIGAGIQDTYFRPPRCLFGRYRRDTTSYARKRSEHARLLHVRWRPKSGWRRDHAAGIAAHRLSDRRSVKSYDFQAPISNNGEERESLRRIDFMEKEQQEQKQDFELYAGGGLRQVWAQAPRTHGGVVLFEAASAEDLNTIIQSFPLIKASYADPHIVPLQQHAALMPSGCVPKNS